MAKQKQILRDLRLETGWDCRLRRRWGKQTQTEKDLLRQTVTDLEIQTRKATAKVIARAIRTGTLTRLGIPMRRQKRLLKHLRNPKVKATVMSSHSPIKTGSPMPTPIEIDFRKYLERQMATPTQTPKVMVTDLDLLRQMETGSGSQTVKPRASGSTTATEMARRMATEMGILTPIDLEMQKLTETGLRKQTEILNWILSYLATDSETSTDSLKQMLKRKLTDLEKQIHSQKETATGTPKES